MKKNESQTGLPPIVSQEDWQSALDKLRIKEKAATRERDALAAERRRLPMVKIDKKYEFQGLEGKLSFLDLFEGRRQLLIYHFMFAPGVEGWPTKGCSGCSMSLDEVCHLSHLHARDTSFCVISLAPLPRILHYKKEMGWDIPWVSSANSDFNRDFGVTTPEGEGFGLSVFLRNENNVYRTYFTTARGCESLGSVWSLLDLTPFGRQETWEVTPRGRPQTSPYDWWRRHNEYGT